VGHLHWYEYGNYFYPGPHKSLNCALCHRAPEYIDAGKWFREQKLLFTLRARSRVNSLELCSNNYDGS